MDEQQLQQQLVQLVQAAMQGDQQASQQIQQIMQAAQQGDQQATQMAQMIQLIMQQMQQQQVRAAKFGAKLNYIKELRGDCPNGTQTQYFKIGGQLCKKCVAKSSVDSFKCGRKIKKHKGGANIYPAEELYEFETPNYFYTDNDVVDENGRVTKGRTWRVNELGTNGLKDNMQRYISKSVNAPYNDTTYVETTNEAGHTFFPKTINLNGSVEYITRVNPQTGKKEVIRITTPGYAGLKNRYESATKQMKRLYKDGSGHVGRTK